MGADGIVKVKLGDPIPLKIQEANADASKVIKATLYDLADMTTIPGSWPITIPHIIDGAYFDDSIVYPAGVDRIYAQFKVFDTDGVTANTTGEHIVHDLYERDDLDAAIADLKTAVRGTDLIAVIEDPLPLKAVITDGDDLIEAVIDEGELTATITEGDETISASIDDPETLKGEL